MEDDDGRWHMYAASFGNNKALGSWLSNSRVVHGVAAHPEGPYKLADIALGRRADTYWDGYTQHNPAVQRDPVSGESFMVFCMHATATRLPFRIANTSLDSIPQAPTSYFTWGRQTTERWVARSCAFRCLVAKAAHASRS